MGSSILIQDGAFEAEVDPSLGGALLNFREKGAQGWVEWLRPAPKNCTDVLQSACYPLVPFSNRIAQGRFNWRGKSITLPPNFPPEPHAIHGHGWQSVWDVKEQAANCVELSLGHDADAWPWGYEARQEICIRGGALNITLSLTNRSADPMPAGIGLHPFFPRTAMTSIKAKVGAIHLNGPDGLPTKSQTQHPAIGSLCAGDDLASGLDNVFQDWDGRAVIRWPNEGRSLTMTAGDPLHHLVIFTPNDQNFFCVEPASHLNGAFGKTSREAAADDGLVELGTGESITAEVIFNPDSD